MYPCHSCILPSLEAGRAGSSFHHRETGLKIWETPKSWQMCPKDTISSHQYDQYPLGFSGMTELLGDTEHSEKHSEKVEMIII